MKSLKGAIGTTVTLGVLSLTISASADIYAPNFPVVEVHGSKGGYSSSSLAAASIMSEKGSKGTYLGVSPPTQTSPPPTNWEASLTVACQSTTLALESTSLWPSTCDPIGMAGALNTLDGTGAQWLVATAPNTATGKSDTLDTMVAALLGFGSPVVVPFFGNATHFISVIRLDATSITKKTLVINSASFLDGGPVVGLDSQGGRFSSGLQTFSGSVFANFVFSLVTGINPNCDSLPGGCGASPFNDPFFNKFVLIYDPPAGQQAPNLHASFAKAPGIVPAGHNAMNAQLAQRRLWDALIAADINKNPATWDPLAGAVPGPASLVNGMFADGSPWDYYLVPILQDASTAVGIALLSADDGSFQHIQVFDSPVPYTPVTKTRAAQLAGNVLAKGDRLTTGGVLTWNPRSDPELAWSPNAPYYEFGVIDANGKSSTARVMLHDGTAVRGRLHDGTVVRGQ